MRYFAALLVLVCIFTGALAEGVDVDLSELTLEQLNAFSADIDAEIKLHHRPDSNTESAVLSATQDVVESYFSEQGIEISWAWVDYEYSREWDFYTLSTHIDYRDALDEKHKPDVYAELFPENGEYVVYYLLVGTEVLVNRREELPEVLWAEEPQGIVNEATNTDLSKVSAEELKSLKTAIKDEIKANHSTNSTTSNLVLSLAKLEVEKYFSQQDIEVSWAWFDYDYTCDWAFYTLTTPIDYKDSNGKYQNSTVYAESYPISGQYTLCYLTIDDLVLVDRRDELPENLSVALISEADTSAPEATLEATNTPVPEATPEATNTPEPEVTPEVTNTPEPEATPEPTATPESTSNEADNSKGNDMAAAEPIHLEKGSKGDAVFQLQNYLIAAGFLSGDADGNYGKNTTAAVKAFQEASALEITGFVEEEDMDALRAIIEEQAKRAVIVAMTNCQAPDVFTSDGNNYDPSRFHGYADTSGFYMSVYTEGNWTGGKNDTWNIEDIILKLEGYDSYLKATCTVTFDGTNYIVSNVSKTIASLEYLDFDDPSKINFEQMEPSDFNSFLTVSPDLVRENRTQEQKGASSQQDENETIADEDSLREEWIGSQFSIWNGAHKDLEDLIKKNLNDEKSYKHIETQYIDVNDEDMASYVNQLLKDAGYSQRVEKGDLFIMMQFSAKNAFNATIKNTALGIASYNNNTISLIGVE